MSYCRRGWSVIPIRPGAKKPIIAWAPYIERPATEAEITAWWEKWPNANVGIVTGRVSRCVVIDIDDQPDAQFSALLAPTGVQSRTGSGGSHLFYRTDEAVPNRVSLSGGVDVRGDGGFVVVPPSIHPNGMPYRWVSADGEMAPLPVALLAAIRQASGNGSVSGDDDMWLNELMQGTTEGARNASAARLAGYLISKRMPRDVVITLMRQWNSRNKPPMEDAELERTVDSVAARDGKKKDAQSAPRAKLELFAFSDFMQEFGQTEIQWSIEGWLPASTIAFAIAPPGTYKTWMLFDAALSVATGTPFMGRYLVHRKGPVLVFQQEDFRGTMAERYALVVNSKFPMGDIENGLCPPPEIPLYVHLDRQLHFADKESMSNLRMHIQQIRPVLVVIDPLYSAASTDDYMSKAAEQMLALKGLRDEFGCSFLIAHHTKKSVEDSAREGLWGSQFLNALLETGWQIRANKDGVIVRRHFKSSKDQPTIRLTFHISDTPPFRYEVTESECEENAMDMSDRILGVLPATGAQLAEKLKVNRSTITRRLQALAADKMVVRDGRGVYSIPDLEV